MIFTSRQVGPDGDGRGTEGLLQNHGIGEASAMSVMDRATSGHFREEVGMRRFRDIGAPVGRLRTMSMVLVLSNPIPAITPCLARYSTTSAALEAVR
jgi:hypothetical protein